MSSPQPTGPSSPKVPKSPKSPKSPKDPKSPKSPKDSQSPKSQKSAKSVELPVYTGGPTTETFLPASHWTDAPLPDGDADSALGSEAASSTASISSSIMAYRTVNGRTYHAERGNAAYWAANDETQSDAMDFLAHMCRLGMGGDLFKAPLDTDKPLRVLDVGTGTGIWAMDFADEFPSSEVIGTDVSPIQPAWVPPNLKFEIEDCTQPWTFPDNSFDFVHIRLLYGSIPDWSALFDEAYRVCKPGGWIESHEASPMARSDDESVPPDSAIAQWGKFFFESGHKMGRTFRVLEENIQTNNVERLGMDKIGVFEFKSPLGAWPKDPVMNEIGRIGFGVMQDAEGWLQYIAHLVQGWTPTEVTVFCAHLRANMRDPKIHTWFLQRVVWAQKPEKESA